MGSRTGQPRAQTRHERRMAALGRTASGSHDRLLLAFDWFRSEADRLDGKSPGQATAARKRLTDALLAEARDMSRAEIERAKSGRHGPSRDQLKAMAAQ